jgi:hypothetical protein
VLQAIQDAGSVAASGMINSAITELSQFGMGIADSDSTKSSAKHVLIVTGIAHHDDVVAFKPPLTR